MTAFVGTLVSSLTNFTSGEQPVDNKAESAKEKLAGLGLRQQKQGNKNLNWHGHQNPNNANLQAKQQEHEKKQEQAHEKKQEPKKKLVNVSHLQIELDPLSDVEMSPLTMPTPSWISPPNLSNDSRRLSEYPSPWPTFNTELDSPTLSKGAFEAKIAGVIDDLFISEDVEECAFSIQTLGCDTLHDLLLQKLIHTGMEKGVATFPLVTSFVAELKDMLLVTETQLLRTLHSFATSMSDLQLDIPHVEHYMYTLIKAFVDKKVLDGDMIFSQLPEQILRIGNVEPHLSNVRTFKKQLKPLLETFFHTGDFEVFNSAVRRINLPQCHHEFIKQGCLMAFDRHNRERSLLPRLFSNAYGCSLLTSADIQLGFAALLGCLDEGTLDCPRIGMFMTEIMTHAVMDELVSSDLLHRQLRLCFGGVRGRGVLEGVLRRTPEHSRKVWGNGDYNQLIAEMDQTINEFFDTLDFQEVGNILAELHLSKDQEIRFLCSLLTESMVRQQVTPAVELTKYLLDVFWSRQDVATVVESIRATSCDLVLDIPNVRECTTHLMNHCIAVDALDANFRVLDKLEEV
eukprot:GEMP01002800.1.p1 GENE.GEMP01002800.1~~GEMP01002800.1.p1  ORF type:complete len:570 (+),score=112.96 GEMP01002800.1:213-1922(+)